MSGCPRGPRVDPQMVPFKEIIGRSDSDANMLGSMKGMACQKKPMVEVDLCHPFSDQ